MRETEKTPAQAPAEDWGPFGSLEAAAAALYDLLARCGLAEMLHDGAAGTGKVPAAPGKGDRRRRGERGGQDVLL